MKCKWIKKGIFAGMFLGISLFGINWNIEVLGSETVECSTEHSYETVIVKATSSEDGSIIERCEKCGEVKSENTIFHPKTITLENTKYVYDGKEKNPKVNVTNENGDIISSMYYQVQYPEKTKAVAQYNVKITFDNQYYEMDVMEKVFSIIPKTTKVWGSSTKNGLILHWNNVNIQCSGYEIQYDTEKNFKQKNIVFVNKKVTNTKIIKELEKNKVYYVRIRAFKKVGTKRIYSKYSNVAKVQTAGKVAYLYKEGFYYEKISKALEKRMEGKSYQENNYVKFSDLRYVKVEHYGYNGKIKSGEIVVNKKIAKKVEKIIYELYQMKYPIQRMKLIDDYDGEDEKSMSANNTSAFNFRVMTNGTKLSKHAYGLAIDLNPKVNPYVKGNMVSPHNGKVYKERNVSKCKGKYKENMIQKNDKVYKLFKKYGFEWGGDWNSCKDYQHFEY